MERPFFNMKNFIICFFAILFFLSCKPTGDINSHFSEKEVDSLLTNIITLTYQKAPYSTSKTKFNPEFRKFYESQVKNFKIEQITVLADSTYLFFMTRPVGSTNQFKRGVIGKFKLRKGSFMPLDYEEIVNTPHLKEDIVKERGSFLFREYSKNQSLDKYLGMTHYVEWPDSSLVYDKKIHEWVNPKYFSK